MLEHDNPIDRLLDKFFQVLAIVGIIAGIIAIGIVINKINF